MVYVWYVKDSQAFEIYAMTYAMTYSEAFAVLEERGHTLTKSWTKDKGGYTLPSVKNELRERLQPYRMRPGLWRDRLVRL